MANDKVMILVSKGTRDDLHDLKWRLHANSYADVVTQLVAEFEKHNPKGD